MVEENYWVVGAMSGGKKDMLPVFLEEGYWHCWGIYEDDPNWTPQVQKQQERMKKMKRDDFIIVKKMLGRGEKNIEIRAIGAIKDVDFVKWRVYVNWLKVFEKGEKRVPIKGAAASIHGPFTHDNPWIQDIFSYLSHT